ncbi:Lrp/AsnC family transcriptional regulator [Amycolatopsis japonica]|uniref:Lrp/AsnC family transcriptional regulator n=1 Tax=Amycolatopsis japonica TaxID=208439 RepID=UPI003795B552
MTTGLNEADLALVGALQGDPRAPWTSIAAVVGTDATTAARRWEKLHSAGLAWLTAYATPPTLTVAYVDLVCRPDSLIAVTEEVRRWPSVFSVERTTGHHQLYLGIAARDYQAMDELVTGRINRLPGLTSLRFSVATRIYREGSGWLVNAPSRDRHTATEMTARPALPRFWNDAGVRAIVDALGVDGRLSSAVVARECGLGESTVRRTLTRMLRGRELAFRCDIAHIPAGWPVIAGYRLDVPADRLDQVGARVAVLPETRLCAAVVGAGNLVVSAWLRAPADTTGFEAKLIRATQGVRVVDRAVTLWMPKRMGRLLDRHGRATGHQAIIPAGGG